MANFESTPRIGRSQGASIFWGLVSVFFAGAACFYFWQDHENELRARQLSDTVLSLQEQSETLNSQKQELQASADDQKKELDARDEILQEKAAKLAQEESRLESLGVQTQNMSQQAQAQAAVVKKFDAVVRKISKGTENADVVARGGRPVLRVPAASLFATGDATLTHDGKALLGQIGQALDGQLDNFELRIDSFTDGDAEVAPPAAPDATPASGDAPKPDQKKDKTAPAAKPLFASGWELTAARAVTISRYFRDQSSLPFQNVLVVARGDFQPIVPNGKEGHARNRRIEITIAPSAPSFHGSDAASTKATAPDTKPSEPVNPLTPPPDPPAPAKQN